MLQTQDQTEQAPAKPPLLKRLNWFQSSFLIIFHSLALVALLFRPRPIDLALLVCFYLLTGFGITVGFHRLLAHRSFRARPWLRNLLAFFGTASFQGGPIGWCAVHRRHHQVSDLDFDPHSPVKGLFYAHVGWIFLGIRIKRDDLVKDLEQEPFFRWLDGPLNVVPGILIAAFCYLVGGFQAVLWGVFLRNVLQWNATWSVNSLCHTFGSRLYNTPDRSRNFWPVGLWALGEGWHNNHHARPRCAFHGHTWWQIDLSSMVIRTFERLGWADKVMAFHLTERENSNV